MRITPIALRTKLQEMHVNQSALAKGIGMSGPVISAYLSGTYKGNIPELEKKIEDWLRQQGDRAAISEMVAPGSIVVTKAYKEIHAALRITERDRDMGLVTGKSGLGKTTALREFKALHPTSILIEADHGYTASALFRELCEALGLDTHGSLHELKKRVVSRLQGSGRLIIVDEAEHLPKRALELIRSVYDKAEVGVALVGLPLLRANLQGNPANFEQLYSRIGLSRKVPELPDDDIDSIVRSRLGDVDPEILDGLRKACRRNARTLSKICRWYQQLAPRNEHLSGLDLVREAAAMVVIE